MAKDRGNEHGGNRYDLAWTNSVTFPAWLHTWEAKAQLGAIHLLADNLQACEAFMLRGEAEFLLYHHHPAAPSRLGLDQCIESNGARRPWCRVAANELGR